MEEPIYLHLDGRKVAEGLMPQLKAIETVYNGYRFRSRLEARWAVFFDTLGIKYEYEKEGYDLDGTWYLPDFWLPEQDCWFEVKPDRPSKNEREKAIKLCISTQKEVVIYGGQVWHDNIGYGFCPLSESIRERIFGRSSETDIAGWISKEEYITMRWVTDIQQNAFMGFDTHLQYIWYGAWWGACAYCKSASPGVKEFTCLHVNKSINKNTRIIEAYTAARQARFEHQG